MANGKKSFVMYADYINIFRKLPKEKAGELIMHILEYVNDNNPTTDDLVIDLCFEPIKLQLKRDLQKYEISKFDKGRAGEIGNLKRWNPDLYNKFTSGEITFEQATEIAENRRCDKNIADAIKTSQMRQSATNLSQKIAVTVNDTVNVTVTDNVNDSILLEKESKTENLENEVFEVITEQENGKEKSCAQKESNADFKNSLIHYGFKPSLVDEWLLIRKKKKAINSKIAFLNFIREVEKCNKSPNEVLEIVVQKQWKGLEAQWIINSNQNFNNNGKSQKIGGIDIETLKRNHATIEQFKRKEQDSGNNDW